MSYHRLQNRMQNLQSSKHETMTMHLRLNSSGIGEALDPIIEGP